MRRRTWWEPRVTRVVLPVLNAKGEAVRMAVKAGPGDQRAQSPRQSVFSRAKNYFYPDLPKGYQIQSVRSLPIVAEGALDIVLEGTARSRAASAAITRARHLEEDAGKSLHEGLAGGVTGIDLKPRRHSAGWKSSPSRTCARRKGSRLAYMKEGAHPGCATSRSANGKHAGKARSAATPNVFGWRPAGRAQVRPTAERRFKNLNSFRFVRERATSTTRVARARSILLESGGSGGAGDAPCTIPNRGRKRRAMRSKEGKRNDYRLLSPTRTCCPVVGRTRALIASVARHSAGSCRTRRALGALSASQYGLVGLLDGGAC